MTLWYPNGRITVPDTELITLTRAAHKDKMLWWDDEANTYTNYVHYLLPEEADRKVGDSYYFVTRFVGSAPDSPTIRPSRDTAIRGPLTFGYETSNNPIGGSRMDIFGYEFAYPPYVGMPYRRTELWYETTYLGGDKVGWLCLTYSDLKTSVAVLGRYDNFLEQYVPTEYNTNIGLWIARYQSFNAWSGIPHPYQQSYEPF